MTETWLRYRRCPAVDAVLDEFELARVVEGFFAENLLGHLPHFGWQGGELGYLPPDVVLIELTQHAHKKLQQAHRERTGTAGGVEDAQPADGRDHGSGLGTVEPVGLHLLGNQFA